MDVLTFATLGEGTSVNSRVVLGIKSSALENPIVAEKFLQGVMLSVDKETASKLDLNMATI